MLLLNLLQVVSLYYILMNSLNLMNTHNNSNTIIIILIYSNS